MVWQKKPSPTKLYEKNLRVFWLEVVSQLAKRFLSGRPLKFAAKVS